MTEALDTEKTGAPSSRMVAVPRLETPSGNVAVSVKASGPSKTWSSAVGTVTKNWVTLAGSTTLPSVTVRLRLTPSASK